MWKSVPKRFAASVSAPCRFRNGAQLTVISLSVTALASLAAGFIIWGADRRRHRYGVFLLPGLSLAVAMVLWVFLGLAGTGSDPALYRLPWILPPLAGTAGAGITALVLGPRREARDTADLERALRL